MDTEKYKNRLNESLTQVTDELKGLGIHNPEVASDWIATPASPVEGDPDKNTVADTVEDWDERRATLSVLETRYNNIKLALKKIEDSAFGICEICGETIEEDRLEANPAARTCKEHLNNQPN